jgi:hypothetical protein
MAWGRGTPSPATPEGHGAKYTLGDAGLQPYGPACPALAREAGRLRAAQAPGADVPRVRRTPQPTTPHRPCGTQRWPGMSHDTVPGNSRSKHCAYGQAGGSGSLADRRQAMHTDAITWTTDVHGRVARPRHLSEGPNLWRGAQPRCLRCDIPLGPQRCPNPACATMAGHSSASRTAGLPEEPTDACRAPREQTAHRRVRLFPQLERPAQVREAPGTKAGVCHR